MTRRDTGPLEDMIHGPRDRFFGQFLRHWNHAQSFPPLRRGDESLQGFSFLWQQLRALKFPHLAFRNLGQRFGIASLACDDVDLRSRGHAAPTIPKSSAHVFIR